MAQYSPLTTNPTGVSMRARLSLALAASLLFAAGCNNPKSPEAAAKEVAKAEQKADKEVAKSEDAAAKDLGNAAGKVDDKMVAFNNAAAKDAYNLEVAQADGNRKVALANCAAMAGEAQKTCKDQADADYSAAKANAKAAAQSEKQ
jgi:hypothetical protein